MASHYCIAILTCGELSDKLKLRAILVRLNLARTAILLPAPDPSTPFSVAST